VSAKFPAMFGWHVYVGGVKETRSLNLVGLPDDALAITDRVRGFTCSFQIGFGRPGIASATIELDNSDGYFTPHATTYDEASVTYDDPFTPYGGVRVDWFGEPIFIMPLDDTTYPVLPGNPPPYYEGESRPCFAGVVSGVEFTDDGFQSSVILSCEDVFSYLARYALSQPYSFVDLGLSRIIEYLFFVVADREAVPKFGADDYNQSITLVPPPDFQDQEIDWQQGEFLGDILQRHTVGEYGIYYPPKITYSAVPFPSTDILISYGLVTQYGGVYPRERLWPTPDPITFPLTTYTFTDASAALDFYEYPFRRLESGVRLESITNQAVVTRAGISTVQQATNSGAVNVYGPRTSQFRETSLVTDAAASDLATTLSVWFDTVTYGIESLEISGGMIETYCKVSDPAAYLFKWPNEMLWQLMKVQATGAGGATIDAEVAFFQAELSVTPRDWVVRFSGGRPWDESFGFILDDTDLGVLDENRV
jgi:hypothetical protein